MWKYLRIPRIFRAPNKYSLRWCALGPGGNVCILNRDHICRLGAILTAWVSARRRKLVCNEVVDGVVGGSSDPWRCRAADPARSG